MSAQIHHIGAERHNRGARPRPAPLRPAEPIPFTRKLLKLKERLFGASDLKSLQVSPEALQQRQLGLLLVWFDTTADACGIQETKRMLEGRLQIAEFIIAARGEQ